MAILVIPAPDEPVAVLASRDVVGVLAVLALHAVVILDRQFRDDAMQLLPLIQKAFGRIVGFSVTSGIPFITPPTGKAVDGKRGIGRVDRHNVLLTKIAIPPIKIAFVAERKASLLPAVGTERGRRNCVFLSRKYWRYLIVKLQIIRSDLEGLLAPAICAGPLHQKNDTRCSRSREGLLLIL